MNTPKNIFHLIAFSQDHIDAWGRIRVKDEEYSRTVEGMSPEEKKIITDNWKKNHPHVPETGIHYGKAYRGCFLNRDELIDIIERQNDAWGLCEGYYVYLLIEKRTIGEIDDTNWGDEDDSELWFKFSQVGEDEYRYLRIDKPDCFKQTCGYT